jgi:release factor glutamine methyltransferase
VIAIGAALTAAAARLTGIPDGNPRLEAELLLAEALQRSRAYLYAWGDQTLFPEQERLFSAWVERRRGGEPLAYLLGRRAFWSLELRVTPAVLIPRPETELLVEQALSAFPADEPITVADLGTGSGALAAALADERPHWTIHATDRSPAALAVARDNFTRLGLRVQSHLGDWCRALPPDCRCELMLSNPPYLADDDPHLRQGDLPREPRAALAAGPDGLDALTAIIRQAPAHLLPGGRLLLEHGFAQGEPTRALLQAAGYADVQTWRDLAGLERVSGGRWWG